MLQTSSTCSSPSAGGRLVVVERLPAQCAAPVWALLQTSTARGDVLRAEKGAVRRNRKSIPEPPQNLAAGRAVGTNMYPNTLEKPLKNMFPGGEKLYRARKASVDKFLELTDRQHAAECLDKIMENVHEGDAKFVDAVIEAFLAGATVGEVRNALNDGFEGEESVKAVGTHRWTEQIEALRKTTEEFAERTGKNIRVFLANMGPIPQHKARADAPASWKSRTLKC
ncbi:MAG: methylmalonyl-CoA mutase family protein [Cloacibacillus evryensis]